MSEDPSVVRRLSPYINTPLAVIVIYNIVVSFLSDSGSATNSTTLSRRLIDYDKLVFKKNAEGIEERNDTKVPTSIFNPSNTSYFIDCSHYPVLHGGSANERAQYTDFYHKKEIGLHHQQPEMYLETSPSNVSIMKFLSLTNVVEKVDVKVWNGQLTGQESTVIGNYVAVPPFISDNFGHNLHDNLPVLAWLKEKGLLEGSNGLILENQILAKSMLRWIEPDLMKRTLWLPHQAGLTVRGSLKYLIVDNKSGRVHSVEVIRAFKTMIDRNAARIIKQARHERDIATGKQQPSSEQQPPIVIIYTRANNASPDSSNKTATVADSYVYHGRVVDHAHEKDIAHMVQAALRKYKRKEEIVWFSGKDPLKPNQLLSFSQQFDLFRRASLVIGPHGSGLANVAWMGAGAGRPDGNNDTTIVSQQETQQDIHCTNRPKVIEYLDGDGKVQHSFYSKTYYNLLSGIPWVEYHHVLYAANSTPTTTFINLNDLRDALDVTLGS